MSSSPKKKMKFSQNKAKYYSKPQNQQFMSPGMCGFLATCNFREKDCVREAYNILRTYADELYGPEDIDSKTEVNAKADEEASDDIADQLEKEVNAAKKQQKKHGFHRFQRVDSGANNCIFIRTTLNDPVDLASRIVSDIKTTMQQKTRFLLRLVPIEAICRIDDMDTTAGKLFDKYFLKGGGSFSIVFNRRLNNDVKRDKVIADLADLVHTKNVGNRVDLKNPDKTIVVEIIKGLCLLSVIPGYMQYKKYNLVELANPQIQDKVENQNPSSEKKLNKDDDAIKADIQTTEDEASDLNKEDKVSDLNVKEIISENQNEHENTSD